tara:strand:- start:654 stop:860 length:207 start_codon:yes stop_codon:yes gene_type:complete
VQKRLNQATDLFLLHMIEHFFQLPIKEIDIKSEGPFKGLKKFIHALPFFMVTTFRTFSAAKDINLSAK